jgi:hypothetical protein
LLTAKALQRRLSKSELVRRALLAFRQVSEEAGAPSAPSSGDPVADLIGG